jgi:hypothetical protein
MWHSLANLGRPNLRGTLLCQRGGGDGGGGCGAVAGGATLGPRGGLHFNNGIVGGGNALPHPTMVPFPVLALNVTLIFASLNCRDHSPDAVEYLHEIRMLRGSSDQDQNLAANVSGRC